MTIVKFEDIIAWQKAQDLAVEIYGTFRGLNDFNFRSQICRAALSISNNIAEGFDRNTDREFARFLYIAAGSCSELRSMLYLAWRLQYLDSKKEQELLKKANELSKVLFGLIKSIAR
jgi:four helix bundle protein